METHPAKRRSEAARRSKEVPQDLTQDVGTILQSTVLEHSTASPLMILLLAGASYVCWTQPGTLQQLRGSTGCGSFVERITRREVVSPRIEGSEHAPDPANSPVCVFGPRWRAIYHIWATRAIDRHIALSSRILST